MVETKSGTCVRLLSYSRIFSELRSWAKNKRVLYTLTASCYVQHPSYSPRFDRSKNFLQNYFGKVLTGEGGW